MSAVAEILHVSGSEERLPQLPQDWSWPAAPEVVEVFDKYSGQTVTLRLSEHEWTIATKGGISRVLFPAGELGRLQRRLVLLSRRDVSPAVIRNAAATLIQHWSTMEALLTAPIDELRMLWEERASKARQAATYKSVLKLACVAEVGPWRTAHLALVKSLGMPGADLVRAQSMALRGRKLLAGVGEQAAIVRFLDTASRTDELSDLDVEGAATLALVYQHGVRLVQALCLETRHVSFFRDASEELACLVSFHAAKQKGGKTFEIVRQVKPEWVPLLARLHATAIARGRSRLFSTAQPGLAWTRAKAACRRLGSTLSCTSKSLRHSAAQALADAGHSRASIRIS